MLEGLIIGISPHWGYHLMARKFIFSLLKNIICQLMCMWSNCNQLLATYTQQENEGKHAKRFTQIHTFKYGAYKRAFPCSDTKLDFRKHGQNKSFNYRRGNISLCVSKDMPSLGLMPWCSTSRSSRCMVRTTRTSWTTETRSSTLEAQQTKERRVFQKGKLLKKMPKIPFLLEQ